MLGVPCNSDPLCAAAIAFPSNTHNAAGNKSDSKDVNKIVMSEERGVMKSKSRSKSKSEVGGGKRRKEKRNFDAAR